MCKKVPIKMTQGLGANTFGKPRFNIIEVMGKIPVVSAALGPVARFPAGDLSPLIFQ